MPPSSGSKSKPSKWVSSSASEERTCSIFRVEEEAKRAECSPSTPTMKMEPVFSSERCELPASYIPDGSHLRLHGAGFSSERDDSSGEMGRTQSDDSELLPFLLLLLNDTMQQRPS
jgi:hypothetical protein